MSNTKKVLNIHQTYDFDGSKVALVNGVYTYDGNSLFTAFVDMSHVSINDCGVTFTKLLPKFDSFLNNLCKYINNGTCSRYINFCNLINNCDDKFIHIEFQIKAENEYIFYVDVKNYEVIVDKTNKCKIGNDKIINIEIITYLHTEIGLTKQDFQSNNNCVFIRACCQNGHIDVVKYLHQEIGITKQYFQSDNNYSCQLACSNGHIDVVKYLHQEIGLTKKDFQSCDNFACQYACKNGYLDVVKYLYQEIGLTKKDFQSSNNYACRWACYYGHFDVVKYLNKEIKLTKEDFQSNNNYACLWTCGNGHIDVVKYLHQEIGLAKQDFQSNNNYVFKCACSNGHLNVIEYLHREIKLSKHDFQSNNNSACLYACSNGHIDVVKYLHQEIGLTKHDFQSDKNYACQRACHYGHIDVVKYLHQEIGLTKQDFQSKENYACQYACKNNHVDVVKYLHKEIGISNDVIINYLSNLQFDITNINKSQRTYTITTNDVINKYPELKYLDENSILYNHTVENIEYIDIHLNLPSNKFTLWSNNVKSLCAFYLEENQLNEIKKYIKSLKHLEFDGIEFTYLENNEYKHYNMSKYLEFYSKLIGNEKIIMDVRIYSNGTYKMTKLF